MINNQQEKEGRPFGDVMNTVQNVLGSALGLAAVLTAQGFVIVHSYLTFSLGVGRLVNVNPNQYLIAGAGFFILFSGVLGIVVVTIRKLVNPQFNPFHVGFAALIWLPVYIIVLGIIYGVMFFSGVPAFLGGGMPERVFLVCNEAEQVDAIGLPILTKTDGGYVKTDTVRLITELTDGFLIWESNSQRVISVKDDLIVSIVDAHPGDY